MEGASVAAVAASLAPGQSTVGTRVDVAHLAPTPVGMSVAVEAVLEEVDGRRLVFSVRARDEVGEVGRGTHERFIVDLESFEERLRNRVGPRA
jgi:fluoroacetyl-CoA thioesterase